MNRRAFLKTMVGVGVVGGVCGLKLYPYLRDAPETPPEVNTTPYQAYIPKRSERGVSVLLLFSPTAPRQVPLLIARREFSGGRIIDSESARVQPADVEEWRFFDEGREYEGSAETHLTFDADALPENVPWQYIVYTRNPTGHDAQAYLCESNPLVTVNGETRELEPSEYPSPDQPASAHTGITRRRDIEGAYKIGLRWPTDDGQRATSFEVSKSAYASVRSRLGSLRDTTQANTESPILDSLLETLLDGNAETLESPASEVSLARNVIRFVQNIPYRTDRDTTGNFEYYRTGEEVLVDGCGDCEDTAFLLGGLLSKPPFSYRTAVLFPKRHALLGVHRDDLPADLIEAQDEKLVVHTINGEEYIPIETTALAPIGRQEDPENIIALVDGKITVIRPRLVAETAVELSQSFVQRTLQRVL